MMAQPPSPGLLGAAGDFLRLLLGTRLLSTCAITLLFRLPLPLAAATHTAVVLLARNNAAYCEAQVGGQLGGRAVGRGGPVSGERGRDVAPVLSPPPLHPFIPTFGCHVYTMRTWLGHGALSRACIQGLLTS